MGVIRPEEFNCLKTSIAGFQGIFEGQVVRNGVFVSVRINAVTELEVLPVSVNFPTVACTIPPETIIHSSQLYAWVR